MITINFFFNYGEKSPDTQVVAQYKGDMCFYWKLEIFKFGKNKQNLYLNVWCVQKTYLRQHDIKILEKKNNGEKYNRKLLTKRTDVKMSISDKTEIKTKYEKEKEFYRDERNNIKIICTLYMLGS